MSQRREPLGRPPRGSLSSAASPHARQSRLFRFPNEPTSGSSPHRDVTHRDVDLFLRPHTNATTGRIKRRRGSLAPVLAPRTKGAVGHVTLMASRTRTPTSIRPVFGESKRLSNPHATRDAPILTATCPTPERLFPQGSRASPTSLALTASNPTCRPLPRRPASPWRRP